MPEESEWGIVYIENTTVCGMTEDFTIECLYQAFKDRLLREMDFGEKS